MVIGEYPGQTGAPMEKEQNMPETGQPLFPEQGERQGPLMR
jgi:hypothetical protein